MTDLAYVTQIHSLRSSVDGEPVRSAEPQIGASWFPCEGAPIWSPSRPGSAGYPR
jgi:hypothetical protein